MKMIFIVGASRSGTTMLNRILGNHSHIAALNELHYFGDLWQPDLGYTSLPINKLKQITSTLITRHRHGIWRSGTSKNAEEVAEKITQDLNKNQLNGIDLFYVVMKWVVHSNNCSIISEQTPRNIFYAQRLLEYYQDANIIQLIRDPRAVLSSQKNRWRRKWLGGKNTPWLEIIRVWINYHPITMTKLWMKATKAGLGLAHHPRYLSVKFEDLVDNPHAEIRRICNFLSIEYQHGMEKVPHVGSSINPNTEHKQGISSDTLFSWKKTLTRGEIAICEYLTKSYMIKYSYTPVSAKTPILSVIFYLLLFPIHVLGVILINPRRAWIQLKASATN